MNRFIGDIDIDFSNRSLALDGTEYVSASIFRNNRLEKHNTGVYFHSVPTDPITNLASVPYDIAENKLGWYKIDFLNVSIYEQVSSRDHLIKLIKQEVDWKLFEYEEFVSNLIHLKNHAKLVVELKPSSILDIATILALIRPGKKHLTQSALIHGLDFIQKEIWTTSPADEYSFRKAHAVSYAMLVKVHANLLVESTN